MLFLSRQSRGKTDWWVALCQATNHGEPSVPEPVWQVQWRKPEEDQDYWWTSLCWTHWRQHWWLSGWANDCLVQIIIICFNCMPLDYNLTFDMYQLVECFHYTCLFSTQANIQFSSSNFFFKNFLNWKFKTFWDSYTIISF